MATCSSIVWFRRDLRLEDNPALIAATRSGSVIPVFIWCPAEDGQFHPGRVSRWWLKQSLMHLDTSLRRLGSPLIMRKAHNTLSMLLEIVEATGATQVFFNHLYDPVSLVRDHSVKQGLAEQGISVHTFNGDLLHEPWEVYDDNGQAFTVFNAYWQKCLNLPHEPEAPVLPPRRLTGPIGKILSCSAEELGLEDSSEKSSNALLARAWCPGWSYANKSLEAFLQGSLLEYATNRQKVDGVTTSLLSPHLHFGELSVRKLFYEVRTKQVTWTREANAVGEQNVTLFLRSIGFREYSRYLSFHFPFTHERSLLANLKSFPWRVDEAYFKAWRQGRTGYPLVDAGMRELWATGWLHNRIRIVVSSFFVKFLQLPWRWGMKYFWDTLLDADLECDVLGWQYISGSLPDGHELDRMDNPQVEGYRFDPDGEYVRRWLPELSRLPTEWIHHPWDAPLTALRAAGVELGTNYPRPIVEMGVARERLQASLAEMWEREAASKAILANGLEEGLGETTEVPGTGGPFHERMDVHTVVVRQLPAHSGSFLRDRLVPVLPTTSQLQAAASILHRSMPIEEDIEEAIAALPPSVPSASARLSMAGHSRPLEGHVQGFADRSQSGQAAAPILDLDFNSTAESRVRESAESDGRAVPVWSPSVLSHAQLQASAECVVPEIANVRRGSFSRRLTQSMLRANQETSSLSA
ncbi:hypothetical protein CY35_07G065700 [Sphagnum magellanicum]|uniref:Uncharacterized protein n=2 Tax=Sphagnum magellanicum TaxID=128215 RepID=A0ACB8HLE8_9BRYO|nr:hypothetical protein CY35_07G065700 [Sphagnum magellanicum]KAH9557053.1 hypothetical protein CY35_07G065700 [Sphagnum magellanicum]